ncbi:MAG: hypothetical protein A3F83_07775 [Candidatus Glassbacteria bacterium RIFCSPLOWO2_12_FULL_58_11]|uniref:Antitoxin n=2 Tax=Candidatus Glassiibacteriota TaxID=1817805 RepID=A0A1F5YRX6_9BACT|nr:MAG: hypothetical protein A2Z86_09665 [Candidatus Glassbacteria bacterium GWA2_58_10]OGG02876.1 MAG: hypothetical protein A3F83_07775 [Candidatus Glassbacteria bacterium RIFCSPLOWO2_12_FULL_58_11]
MAKLAASQTRIPTRIFNDVVFRNARVVIERRDGEKVYLISQKDLELFEALTDYVDNVLADQALKEMEVSGRKSVPLEQVKAEMGL